MSGLPEILRHQVLREWNDTPESFPSAGKCLHELVAEQAARTPDAVAVVCEGKTLTYGELRSRAGRLARHLRSLGVTLEQRVGVLLERSFEMIVALLGVLEAGAAYVPLEPTYPAERLALLIESSGAAVVVAQEKWAHLLPGRGEKVVLLAPSPRVSAGRAGEGSSAAADQRPLPDPPPLRGRGSDPVRDPQPGATPANLAYVIFTSGSTGTPKGVMVPHRGVVNRLLWGQETYRLTPEDRVLQKTPFSFDVSVWELFWPLTTGARLIFARPDGHRDPEYLAGLIARERITVVQFVPSVLRAFLAAPETGLASVRLAVASGEALPPDLVRRFYERIGTDRGPILHNLYGPTEASIEVSSYACEPEPSIVPIGRPISNLRLYVVDRELEPMPPEGEGELMLGGVDGIGLARGYLGRPDLTATAFVPDPLSGEPGSRLYRSGDLSRTLPDGNVDYLGRIDHQVKIHGTRIELGEIEAALRSHPGVRECVVLARTEAPGAAPRLVAYVVRATGSPVEAAELRSFAGAKLPAVMVPAVTVFLEAMPLTTSGKVDRKALPAPERGGSKGSEAEAADPVARELAGIWAEVLSLDGVGTSEDFFALGADSLTVAQVLSRIRERLGVELPQRQVFESRTVAALAQAVRDLGGKESEGWSAGPLSLRRLTAHEGSLPLSFAQQRLWFLDQLEPGNAAYNVASSVRLTGELSVEALERAFAELSRRHETLRTAIDSDGDEPVQAVSPVVLPVLSQADLSGLAPEERETRARALAVDEIHRPFDLRQAPLMRALLVRLSSREHLLVTTLHHVVADGWSLGVVRREIAALYAAFAAGEPSPLPELPIQYADFAVWQRDWLRGEILESQLAYWKGRLAGAPQMLALPTDRPRPAVQTYRGESRPVDFSPELSESIRELCRREGLTPFMVLLAAWSAFLGRHAGQEDVLLGTPIAGRNLREVEGLIGVFVNTLVLRVDLSGTPSFAGLLERVRRTALDAYAHQDLPFERLVEELVPDRDLSRSPLTQVALVLQNAEGAAGPVPSLPGIESTPVALETRVVQFDLTLTVEEGLEGFSGILEHNSDLFDRTTAARFLARFRGMLQSALAQPEQAVHELPWMPAAERHQVTVEWAGAGSEPAAETLHDRFEAWARRTPDAPALTCEGETLTYGELNRRAGLLARRLRQLGVGPESRVGLCLERSLELPLAILGILKAGGAYLPLDPMLPAQRLAAMIDDAGIRVLVGTRETGGVLPKDASLAFLDLSEALDVSEAPEVLAGTDGSSLAYLLYTSGSTGRPKGTLITHGNVVRLFDATARRLGPDRMGERDVWTLFHAFTFDFSVWEMWGALLHGGRLVVMPYEVSRSPEDFHGLLARERVTVLCQTPAAFAPLAQVDRERPEPLAALRLVFLGGEALDLPSLASWFERHGDRQPVVVNLYGPTETTVHVTCRRLEARDALTAGSIGSPLDDVSLHVVDSGFRPVPIGVPGEMVAGGAGLARGYLDRPDLTAARFVPDPWSARPGARLYRTGDLGRLLPAGGLEYLGRIDQQVKIRGFRIELGEIQAVLGSHPGVRECAVVVRDEAGPRYLAAYVVLAPGSSEETADLRSFLGDRLPEAMVPAAFVALESLPLTPSGKLDRRKLPVPERSRREGRGEALAPRTPTEEALVAMWKDILRLDQVGVEDSFFALGGHSLLATQAVARLRHAFAVDLSLRDFFKHPTVAALAAQIDAQSAAATTTADAELAALLDELDLLSDKEAREELGDLSSLHGR